MLTAEEARRQSGVVAAKLLKEEQLKKANDKINAAIAEGKTCVWTECEIGDEAKKELEDLGFSVFNFSRDIATAFIKWGENSDH